VAHPSPPGHRRVAKYGTRENVAGLERMGIRAYVAIPNYFDFRDTGLFGPGHFRYEIPRRTSTSALLENCCAGERATAVLGERCTVPNPKPATPASSRSCAPTL
jgi:hypothetical protein